MTGMDANGLETVRGAVAPWECDAVEHFTTGAYFRRLDGATARVLSRLGWRPGASDPPWPDRIRARFLRELRVGDVYHIRSGVTESGDGSLAIGHRIFNSETGEPCTAVLMRMRGRPGADPGPLRMDWDEDDPARAADAGKAATWLASSASIVYPEDTDWAGRMGLGPLILQMSAANIQSQNAVGVTPSYMRARRRGYSTFEYQFEAFGPLPGAGAELETRSAPVHVGSSSLWVMHELYDASDGALLVRLAQLGVHLDLDARRPAPLPDEIRARALGRMKA